MIKKILLAVLVALPMSVAAQKFGVVSAEEIFAAMPEVAEIQTKLGEASKQYEDEYAKLNEEMQKKFAEYQQLEQDASTPQSIKERRMQEIQDKSQKVDQFRNTAAQDLERLRASLMAPIQNKMNEAIKAVGTEGAFTFIFPQEPSLLLYTGTDVTDVTALVKTKLGLK